VVWPLEPCAAEMPEPPESPELDDDPEEPELDDDPEEPDEVPPDDDAVPAPLAVLACDDPGST
jgi:hypothetical protein